MTASQFYERYWSQQQTGQGVAETPSEWPQGDVDRVLGFLADRWEGNIVDFGCGDGLFTAYLSRGPLVKNVQGLDVSEAALRSARLRCPGVAFRTMREGEPWNVAGPVDLVTMVEVLEHLIDVESVLVEAHRALKPDGHLLVTTTDFNWLKKVMVAALVWDRYFYPTNPHIRFFTRKTLGQLLSRCGFEVVKYAWNGSYLGLMPKGQLVLARKIAEGGARG